MSSSLSLLVPLFIGLVGWRIQLIGKRRTELAEEALLGFLKATDALRSVRDPMVFGGEPEALRKQLGQPVEQKLKGETYRVTLWRLDQNREAFAALRRLQLLCRWHFGQAAHDAFEDLYQARREVWVAAHMRATTDEEFDRNPDDRKLGQRWRAAIWGGSTNPDELANKVDAAQRSLEAILTPHLRADAALLPVAVSWRAGKAWIASRRKPSTPTPAPASKTNGIA